MRAGDPEGSNVIIGEDVGLIHDVRPAMDVVETLVEEAEALVEARKAARL